MNGTVLLRLLGLQRRRDRPATSRRHIEPPSVRGRQNGHDRDRAAAFRIALPGEAAGSKRGSERRRRFIRLPLQARDLQGRDILRRCAVGEEIGPIGGLGADRLAARQAKTGFGFDGKFAIAAEIVGQGPDPARPCREGGDLDDRRLSARRRAFGRNPAPNREGAHRSCSGTA
ncbi:MAG: hypothetical protein ACRCTI_03920 [Beijerinckiaceae bacterium]